MKLKSAAFAVALLAGFTSAQASDPDLGIVPASPAFTSTSGLGGLITAIGAFTDVYTFEIAADTTLTTNAFTSGGFFSAFDEIEYSIFNSAFDYIGGEVFGPTLSTSSLAVTAGDYFYVVEGIKSEAGPSRYRISASVTPIPEPETYALMLAGLGAVGFVASRRRAK